MGDKTICWSILPKVSRSFALCIKVLPRPINDQVMAAYLLYRVLDTIEDSSADLKKKKESFKLVLDAFKRPELDLALALVTLCRDRLLSEIDCSYEKVLVENLVSLASFYYSFSAPIRSCILKWGKEMADGMYTFQSKKILTFADQDKYNYYVAGVVGYLFTELLYLNGKVSRKTMLKLKRYAKFFGLALQKINILRDVAADIAAKRYYWPLELLQKYGLSYETITRAENREAALKVLKEYVHNALEYIIAGMRYILNIPRKEIRIRAFCIIPLFMAIESYIKCIDNIDIFDVRKTVKISHSQVRDIVTKCMLWGSSDENLEKWFKSTMERAGMGSLDLTQ